MTVPSHPSGPTRRGGALGEPSYEAGSGQAAKRGTAPANTTDENDMDATQLKQMRRDERRRRERFVRAFVQRMQARERRIEAIGEERPRLRKVA